MRARMFTAESTLMMDNIPVDDEEVVRVEDIVDDICGTCGQDGYRRIDGIPMHGCRHPPIALLGGQWNQEEREAQNAYESVDS
eukprot:CAMPEP_0167798544 /NCGR_PEP_ID=MMETSP0111_2-20121227/16395_1 /TAXON_ID=91324 /ORGANISM="Lotharella globosa, Strain CCCM811" /LENGTH=82 /DNA_ID=CAMNT_0007693025 /DNA_START=146 /DNA_END=393 /DNA_ORIENTATION=-